MKSLIDTLKSLANQNHAKSNRRSKRRDTNQNLTFETLQPRALLATIATADGLWSDPSIWSDGVPDSSQQAIIAPNVTVELDLDESFAKELVIQGDLVVTEDASVPDKLLTTDWVHVNGMGAEFIVGSETDRYDIGTFTLKLEGINKNEDTVVPTVMGDRTLSQNDGFLMTAMMGRVQFFGQEKLSFTKLAETAGPDAADPTKITVANVIERNFNTGATNGDDFVKSAADDGELNWQKDDQIVIASSSYDYTEEEVRIITNVENNGDTTTLTLNEPLEYRHYGKVESYENYEIDLRAEVALLSRNIVITGLESQDTDVEFGDRDLVVEEDRIRAGGLSDAEWEAAPDKQIANGVGGHLMFMPTSGQITVDGVQLDRLGQASTKGRYPIHWHLGEDRKGDVLRNSSITNSNNRGVTIHGTENLSIEGVVLHDIHGHGFFFEDAVETGNELVGNIALGIHSVGGNDKDFANPGGKDPFVVDTHDSVLETGSRFSSSAAFWITNPDNIFVGNIAAGAGDTRGLEFVDPGPAGTGFWYAIPRTSIGASADEIDDYANLTPIFAEFGQFDYNTSHSTAVGLNFDRGSDIEDGRIGESDPGNVHAPNEYSPRVGGIKGGDKTTNFINGFTNYKASDAAVYHRGEGESIQFNDLRIADSKNGPWAVSENIYNGSLFVGHSRGNADESVLVGGPRLYDGAGLYSDTHFAGFEHENAYTFQVEGSSFGPTTYHAFQRTTFENDGSYGNISHAVSDFDQDPADGHDLGRPFKWIKGVIDLDGSLTGAAEGGTGYSIVPNIDFLIEDSDEQPTGWRAALTNDLYARIRVQNLDDGSDKELFPSKSNGEPVLIFTARDGDSVEVLNGQNESNLSWTQIAAKTDEDGTVEGTFEIEFGRLGIPEGGFVLNMKNQDGGRPQLDSSILERVEKARIVVRIVGAGEYTPNQGVEVFNESDLRTATQDVVYFRDGLGNLYLNSGIKDNQPLIEFSPGQPQQTPFVSRTISYGSTIEAEEFDNALDQNDGLAWSETDGVNTLGTFRSETGVDVTETKVGDIQDGEWLEYTANIVPSGYLIGVNVSATQAGGQIRILAAASNSAGFLTDFGVIDVPDTAGDFETVWLPENANLFPISTPESVIRLEFIGGGFDVDSIEFAAPEQLSYVPGRTVRADETSTRIELEEFDRGGQGVAYFDKTEGNGENKPGDEDNFFRDDEDVDATNTQLNGEVFDGEWLEYTTNIEPGIYDIKLLKKWGGENEAVKLFIGNSNAELADDLEFIDEFDFTTGDEEEIVLSGVDLTQWAGSDRVIRIEIVGNYMGLDALEFVSKTQVAPQVESVVVNDGSDHRSMVRSITVNFDEEVTGVDANSFVLTNTTTGSQVIPSVATELLNGRTVATLTFTGSDIIGGSLADGNYTLTTLSDVVSDVAGNQLDGDGDGSGGDNATDAFFRFYGDSDGNGTINIIDFLAFRKSFRSDDPNFDFNGDNTVNIVDFLEFRRRFRQTL